MESEPLLRRKLLEADSAWPLGVAIWHPHDSRMAVVKLLAIFLSKNVECHTAGGPPLLLSSWGYIRVTVFLSKFGTFFEIH